MTIKLVKTRFLIYLIFVLITYFISQIPGILPSLYGVKPNMLLLLALNIALFEPTNCALGFGIICGTFMDIGFGEYFGFYLTIISTSCFFISNIKNKFYNISLLKAYIFATSFSAFTWVCYFSLMLILNNINNAFYTLILRFLISVVYSSSFEFIFYFLIKFIIKITTKKQKNMGHLLLKNKKTSENYNFLGSD